MCIVVCRLYSEIIFKHVAGQAALTIGNSFFSKEASKAYTQLSEVDRERLIDTSEVHMSDAEVNQRVRRVTKRVQTLVCTKECATAWWRRCCHWVLGS